MIYNDIKVDNFMLRERPEGYQLVIVDMGAAEVYAPSSREFRLGKQQGRSWTPTVLGARLSSHP